MISLKIKVLIVDEDVRSCNILQTMITNYCKDVEVIGQANSVENAQFLISLRDPDLILLNIEMLLVNGCFLLDNISKKQYEVVFISAFDHYALKAIQYHVLDYLMKPIDLKELENAIKKVKVIKFGKLKALASNVKAQFGTNNKLLENKLSISTQNGKKLIPVDEILYCKADGACTWIQMSDGEKYYSSKNIGQFEKMLAEYNSVSFFRVHHAYLVNLLKVKSFYLNKNSLELEDGIIIMIAQRRKKELRGLLKLNISQQHL